MIATISTRLLDGEAPDALHLGAQGEERLLRSRVGEALGKFPITSIVSLLYSMEDGEPAEIAVGGKEGILGIAVFLGGGIQSGT